MALYVQKLMYVCTPPGLWAQFHQPSTYRFYARGAQKRKKDSQVISLLHFLDLQALKLSVNMLVKLTPGYLSEKEWQD